LTILLSPRIPLEPRWKPYHKSIVLNLPEFAKGWLLDPGSLTCRLMAASGGDFRVQVLRQSFGKPKLSETRRLGLRLGEWAMIREVALICKGEPWVYARSIIPRTTIVGDTQRLKGLGSRPLGAALFKDPSMHRRVVDIAKVHARNLSYLPEGESSWGRRSLFTVKGQELLVAEIFLPSLLRRKPIQHAVNRRLIC